MKIIQQEKAKVLRKKGFSLKEISKDLKVAKSSVSLWVRDVPLSTTAKILLEKKYTKGRAHGTEVLKARTVERLNTAKTAAVETLKKFSSTQAVHQVCCALIYWCEGSKSINDKELKFTNSDPHLIATYLKLLRNSFCIDEKKFRVGVHLHDYHNESVQLQFWSKTTSIPLVQFIKSYKKPHTGKQRKENYQGCIQISYNDVVIARQVQAIARLFVQKYGPIV